VKGHRLLAVGAVCGAALALFPKLGVRLRAASVDFPRAHTEEKFTFTANAPIEQVAPLFGADRERVWSPRWNPQFINPWPPADIPGMVFTVKHGKQDAVWVNTEFDLENGRVQYVYVVPDVLITVITLRLAPEGNDTKIEVQYDRTALNAEADGHVRHLAEQDRNAGFELGSPSQ
jgi:hypothetical protein